MDSMPMMRFVTVGTEPKRRVFGWRLSGVLRNVGWNSIYRRLMPEYEQKAFFNLLKALNQVL